MAKLLFAARLTKVVISSNRSFLTKPLFNSIILYCISYLFYINTCVSYSRACFVHSCLLIAPTTPKLHFNFGKELG